AAAVSQPVPAPPETSGPLPVIDMANLLDCTADDESLCAQLAKVFAAQAAELIAQLHDALAVADARLIERAAHTLKGSVGSLGGVAAYHAASRLEELARQGDLPGARGAVTTVEQAIARLQSALAELFP